MSTITTYTIRFDGRTKEILLLALNNLHQELEQQIAQGNKEVLTAYDEVSQVKRGVLLSPPEEIETGNLEAENSETVEETPEQMYKSQDRPQ